MARFRIVTDEFAGFEVQIKHFWFWFQKSKSIGCNTFKTIERAKDWIGEGCPKDRQGSKGKKVVWESPEPYRRGGYVPTNKIDTSNPPQ